MIRVYVASPYNNPQGKVMDTRAKDIAYDVNSLMEQCGRDFVFFSPICHGHFISEVAGHVHRGDADYWMPLCESMLKTWADVLVVIASRDDADNSEGIQAEIKIAEEKNIKVIQSYELNVIISKLRMFQIDKKLIIDVTKMKRSAGQLTGNFRSILWRNLAHIISEIQKIAEVSYGNMTATRTKDLLWELLDSEYMKNLKNLVDNENPEIGQSAEQPSRYQSFFDLLDHVKQRTLKNADKGGVYDYDDAFFHKKFDQEREEFLTAIRYGVEEDYMDKAADFIAYYVGWANKIIQEAKNENKD